MAPIKMHLGSLTKRLREASTGRLEMWLRCVKFKKLDFLWQHQQAKLKINRAERCFRPGQKNPAPPPPPGFGSAPPPLSTTGVVKSHYKVLALQRGLGQCIHTIQTSLPVPSEVPVTSDGRTQLLGSYNMTKRGIIAVPGAAAEWKHLQLPFQLSLSSEPDPMEDLPKQEYPYEASFRAIAAMSPAFRFNDVDIICNRNTLKKLFCLCAPKVQQSFRIRLFLVKNTNTLVIESEEVKRGQKAPQVGYGYAFESAFSRFPEELEDTACHHRIISYELGPLRCAVRFQAEVSYTPKDMSFLDNSSGTGSLDERNQAQTHETDTTLPPQSSYPLLSILGTATPQASIAEVKTVVLGGKASPGRHYPQFYFGRTRYLLQGRYDSKGVVKVIHAKDPRP